MILDDILKFNPIYIQCHDNPDADAIASAFGLYSYLSDSCGKDAIMFYSGRNEITKSNLTYMIKEMNIPIRYIKEGELPVIKSEDSNPILVTVDCQYGARNVTKFECNEVAIIDHHQIEINDVVKSVILPSFNACSTIIWKLITKKGYNVSDENHLGSALYYGIYTDTNQLSELRNPDDKDAIDQLPHDYALINFLKNSNISLDELELACDALHQYVFNEEHGCAVVRSEKCD